MSSDAVGPPVATLASLPRRRSVAARGTVALAFALLAVASLATTYVCCDQERMDLTDDARKGVSGSFVRIGDGVVHYELAGPPAGRTVVLVHGFSVPSFIWDPTYDALVAAGRRVLRYDVYGRGWSDRPDVAYDADLFDRQLGELLDALGIHDPVDVAGVSMGGAIAVRFAARHPERVRSLVLVDPAYHAPAPLDGWLRLPLVGEYLMDVKVAPGMAAGQLDDFRHPEGHDDYLERYRTQMRYRGFRRAILSTLRTRAHDPDVREAYATVGASKIPVLLLWGREDHTIPFAVSEGVRKAIPQAEFHPIDDAGHIPQYERPDVVSPIIREFLAR
jgi:pimeloyl-ACP methyl ester carboxylesterase